MTVAELRKIIEYLPDEMLVVVHESEGGRQTAEEVTAEVALAIGDPSDLETLKEGGHVVTIDDGGKPYLFIGG